MKNEGNIIKQITYLFTFELPSISQQINIGPYKMEVAQYIPTSTPASNARSSRTVNNLVEVLPEVTEEGHDAITCDKQIKCTNCNLDHMSSFKECVVDLKEKGTSKHKSEKADHRSQMIHNQLLKYHT